MATSRKLDLLTAVEHIVEKAKGTGLSSVFYSKTDKYIEYVSEKMELTKEQSVMMALFIDNSDHSNILISELCKYLKCRTTRIIKYMGDIDVLEQRGLIRCCREKRNISYRVPTEVIDAFKKNEKYAARDCSALSCQELFGEIEEIFTLREDRELTYEATVEKIRDLFSCNNQLLYVQKVKSYGFSERNLVLLVLFSHLFVNHNDDNIWFYDLEFLYEYRYEKNRLKHSLSDGGHSLIKEKIIEHNNSDGFENRESYRMTATAKRELFSELNLSSLRMNKRKASMVKSKDIVAKKLFYEDKISSQIAELNNLLEDVQYKQIQERMNDTGFRCGFACLFYGAPGTGKTETVLQLARQTGRDIFQVNISQIKSCWVGESEKNIKQVFDDYRAMVKEDLITPILLFNEADAIVGKRKEGANSAVDKMENSIQNIILQELETLDGILIATTNLAGNMDNAFERRFLYKIKFEKPTVEARMNMWHEMIPGLGDDETRVLATRYDFSGGQIENIARHYAINNILHGQTDKVIDTLTHYCDNERIETKEMRKIGF